ncbi:MAG: aspartate kinase, partial [Bacteroidales bacterium]|nr:aspartate kinase [Bacteroidales bacterium]
MAKMRVMKFGGTSVGNPQRIGEVGRLISDSTPKIVVLSAMSGTTNDLVKYAEYLYTKNQDQAKVFLESMRAKYEQVVEELFTTEEYKSKGKHLIDTHFDNLDEFNQDVFTQFEEKTVLAKGELISTALMVYHLQERGIGCVLLPALHFMRIDKDQE